MTMDNDEFELYDLRVEVVAPPGARILCGARPGDHFLLQGEMLTLPPGQGISIYSLAAVLPLLPAKQRVTHENDWMSTDAEVAFHAKIWQGRRTREAVRAAHRPRVALGRDGHGQPVPGRHRAVEPQRKP